MIRRMLAVEPCLLESTRLPALTRASAGIRGVELAWLVLMGLAAAAGSILLDFKLKIPGHAILRCILPMTLGLAMVPRRGAGLIMAATAVGGGLGLQMFRLPGAGVGALTSLALSGVLLDAAASRVRSGWQWYLGVTLAALATNLVAFGVKFGAKMAGLDGTMRQPIGAWWPRAAISYPVCGLIAGLLAVAILFRLRRRDADVTEFS
ncbi:MAG: hypothetical protein JJ992_22740 [Planctomycetes bacterium]|nr:hypothetical protein [Planctomycetota bacterium]